MIKTSFVGNKYKEEKKTTFMGNKYVKNTRKRKKGHLVSK